MSVCNLEIPTCSLEHLTSKSEVRIRGKKNEIFPLFLACDKSVYHFSYGSGSEQFRYF